MRPRWIWLVGLGMAGGLALFQSSLPGAAESSSEVPSMGLLHAEATPGEAGESRFGRSVAGTSEVGEPEVGEPEDEESPPPLPLVRAGMASLLQGLDRILPTARWSSAEWGILVVSAAHGDTLLALNPGYPLAPASNAKVFTSAAALQALGPEYSFPTYVLGDGPVRDGVLEGDLIFYGTGDPTISDRGSRAGTRTLQGLARELKAQGIREIRGDVVGDGTFFQGPAIHESWNPDDLNDWFTAPVSALSFNENVATVRVVPGLPGTPPSLRTLPEGAPFPVVNQAISTNGTRSSLVLTRDRPSDPVRLSGEMGRRGGDAWRVLTVSEPALFAASALRRVLEEEGIVVRGATRDVAASRASRVTGLHTWAPALLDGPATPRVLAVAHSPPLEEILNVVNRRSHNLFAEVVLFTLGRLADGDGSFEGGSRALSRILVEEMGISPGDIVVVDGSGLSRDNRSTPGALVQVLAHMGRSPHREVFQASLPQAGDPRGLRRMYRTAAAGNLRAKTGTIHQVSSLSGRVATRDGEELLFAILANRVPSTAAAKRLEDQLGAELASFRRPASAPALATQGGGSGVAAEGEPVATPEGPGSD